MTSNAAQRPGWWQASDGNWYPPQQQPGYAPAPSAPPAPQPSSTPAAYPQYPAPGGQPFGNAQAAFAGAVARAPRAAWLLFGGFVVAQISTFLPMVTASYGGVTRSASLWSSGGIGRTLFFALGVCAVASVTSFTKPQSQRTTLIGLSVVVSMLTMQLIYNWATYSSQLAEVKRDDPDISDVSFSPGFGLFLYTAAIAFVAVRIAMHWMARSKAQPQAS